MELACSMSRYQAANLADACNRRSSGLPGQQFQLYWYPYRVGVPEAALDVSLLGNEGHRWEAVTGLCAHAHQDKGPSPGQCLHTSLRSKAGLVTGMGLVSGKPCS